MGKTPLEGSLATGYYRPNDWVATKEAQKNKGFVKIEKGNELLQRVHCVQDLVSCPLVIFLLLNSYLSKFPVDLRSSEECCCVCADQKNRNIFAILELLIKRRWPSGFKKQLSFTFSKQVHHALAMSQWMIMPFKYWGSFYNTIKEDVNSFVTMEDEIRNGGRAVG